MSNNSSGENLSESNSDYSDNDENYDLANRQDFDEDNDGEGEIDQEDYHKSTFEVHQPQLVERSSPFKVKTVFSRGQTGANLANNDKPPARPSTSDHATGDNEELKFILSHSNTFLTNEPEEERKKLLSKTYVDNNKPNMIDIDEWTDETYDDLHNRVDSIEKKLDKLIDLFYEEAKQSRKDTSSTNSKIDKLFDLIATNLINDRYAFESCGDKINYFIDLKNMIKVQSHQQKH